MNKVKFLSMFVLLVLLLSAAIITVVGQEPRPQGSAEEGQIPETGAILDAVEEYFDANLQVRLGKAAPATLGRFFDQTNSDGAEALRREATKARGFFERTEQVGPPVQSGSVEVEIGIQRVEGPAADVTVREVLSYIILHPTLGEGETEEVFDHVLHLILSNRWLIVRDDYFDPGEDAMLARGDFTAPTITEVPDDLGTSPDRGAEGDDLPETIYYNRTAAQDYADDYWDVYNPTYRDLCLSGGDCANFASQVVFAGGYPKKWTNPRQWWYDQKGTPGNTADDTWSSSWTGVSPQRSALDYHYGDFVASATNLKVGDLVYMDWTGNGSWDHVAIVVVADPSGGNPLLNAHCNDRYHKSLSWFGAAANSYFHVFDSVP